MPVVTDIKRQQKDASRYSVYIDGDYTFGLDGLELSASNLRVGLELSTTEIEDWQNRSAEGKAYNAATRYLSYRRRSRAEVQQYLKDKDYDQTTSDLTIERLEGLGMIDDAAFAAAWIADRMRLKPRSRSRLVMELRQKGIAAEVIDGALSELSREDQVVALRGVIAKKRHSYANDAKLIQYLSSLGYNYDLIKEAMSENETS
jgi:regulatory protein